MVPGKTRGNEGRADKWRVPNLYLHPPSHNEKEAFLTFFMPDAIGPCSHPE
jgi:hypothetical protein